jgi:NlpC/P60 family putative phage cell wall peptidase
MRSVGEDAARLALDWVGTPYRHQASCKGAGSDCLGLVRGVWREIYGAEPERVPEYSADWAEPSGDEVLWRAAGRHLVRVEGVKPLLGQVILFRMRRGSIAKHLGICTGAGFVHAYAGQGVVHSALSEPWSSKIVAVFEFRERNA